MSLEKNTGQGEKGETKLIVNVASFCGLTRKVLVTTIDALGHF